MIKKSVYLLATILSLVAVTVVSTASVWYIYQGDTPEELL